MTDVLYADFNNMDSSGRIRLNSAGTTEDIQQLSLRLTEGMSLVISDTEMKAKGIVGFSSEEDIWVFTIDEGSVQDC